MAMKPLPPALKALKHILDTLSSEEDLEGEPKTMNVKDLTVRAFYVWNFESSHSK